MTVETLPGFDTDDWPAVAVPGAPAVPAGVSVPGPAGRESAADGSPVPVEVPPAPPEAVTVAMEPPRGLLLAVDGNSLVHRAFHGYGQTGMRGPDQRPLWAVFGFMTLLVRIIDMNRPDAVVVGFDDPAGSTRRDRHPEYKAGRPDRPDELRLQLADTVTLLRALGVAVIVPVGLEADDVLASAAAAAETAGWRCVVATSDKDAFRLISPATTVMRLVSGLDNAIGMTPELLLEQYGVTPAQWPDYTALVGDKSDNLPGVDGIGPKSAAKLLAARGTLDRALADLGATGIAIGKATAARLSTTTARDAIARNRDLMAPVTDVPVDPDQCRLAGDPATVSRVLAARHLPSLASRTLLALCPSIADDMPPTPPDPDPAPAPRRAAAGVMTCQTPQCGAPIRMVWMESGGRMPIDADPTPDGNLGWAKSDLGWRMVVLADGEQPDDGRRWSSHFATCANADEHRRGRRRLGAVRGQAALEEQAAALLTDAGLGAGPVRPAGPNPPPAPAAVPRTPLVQVPAETRPCCTPGHDDGRPARLYPGGVFCDPCIDRQKAIRAAEAEARR